mgnify:CR=1 FL=1
MISFQIDGIEYRSYDHLYAVSRCGKVLRKLTPFIPTLRYDGYLSLGRERLMHRVIAICWIENPKLRKLVHHKDGNKANNHADNLEWVTQKEHMSECHAGLNGHYVRTPEIRAKISKGHLGKKNTEEVAAKKREILSAVCPKSPCKFQGVSYPSVSAGARAAGIPTATFRVRCLSKNFPEYELLSTYYD